MSKKSSPHTNASLTPNTRKFVALFDLHYGYERDVFRHKRPIHDTKAMSVALQFVEDFQPDEIILGGDTLDCGCISPHRKREGPGTTEGDRLKKDARELRSRFLDPLEDTEARLQYVVGNHEAWIDQFVDQYPMLEGIVDLRSILNLGKKWNVIPQGGSYSLGKLTFIHGDQFGGGGDHVAKAAVIAYDKRSVRFGHFHTFQAYTKTSALDIKQGRTGMVVPCLSTKAPRWVKGAPNKWCQGFLFGYVRRDGTFNDYPVIITNGRAIIEGKEYVG